MAGDIYMTEHLPLGIGGLDLKRTIDLVPTNKLTVMKNVDRTEEGRLKLRKGQQWWGYTAAVAPHAKTSPIVVLDEPDPGENMRFPFILMGWAVDLLAPVQDLCGMAFVHVWAGRTDEAAPGGVDWTTFFGQFPIDQIRPGVGAAYGAQFLRSGFYAEVTGWKTGDPIEAGFPYHFLVAPWSRVAQAFVSYLIIDDVVFLESQLTALPGFHQHQAVPVVGVFDVPNVGPAQARDDKDTDGWGEEDGEDEDVPPDLQIRSELKCLHVDMRRVLGPDGDPGLATDFFDDLQRLSPSMIRVPVNQWVEEGTHPRIELFWASVLSETLARGIPVCLVLNPEIVGDPAQLTAAIGREKFALRARDIVSTLREYITAVEIFPNPDQPHPAAKTPQGSLLTASEYADLWLRTRGFLQDVDDIDDLTLVLGTVTMNSSFLLDLYAETGIVDYKALNGVFPWGVMGLAVLDAPVDKPVADHIGEGLWNWGIGEARLALMANKDSHRPIWITEFGWKDTLVTEYTQGELLYEGYRHLDDLEDPECPGAGEIVQRAFWRNYKDDLGVSTYGLLDDDDRQKRAYFYFRLLGAAAEAPVYPPGQVIDSEATILVGPSHLAATGPPVHTVHRLSDPRTGNFTRLVGVGPKLYAGKRGQLPGIDSGYHASPIQATDARPALSGQPWAFLANYNRMRKVRIDGLNLPIGLPAPTHKAGASMWAEQRTDIDSFDQDGWEDPSGVGHFSLGTSHSRIDGVVGGAIRFQMYGPEISDEMWEQGDIPLVNFAYWTKAKHLNLDRVGSRKATDDDIIHVRIRPEMSGRIIDVKIYFVVSTPFIGGRFGLPGNSVAEGYANTDAYVKVFRRHDFEGVIQMEQTPRDASADADASRSTRDRLERRERGRKTDRGAKVRQATRDARRGAAEQLAAGAIAWSEFGVIDVPLRRGDFLRIGQDDDRDWRHVTGIVVAVSMDVKRGAVINDQGDREGVQNSTWVDFDDLYLTGGYNIDNIEFGADHYDWRYINYDPRTGDKSNPSPIMNDDAMIDTPRRAVGVTPHAYGNAAIRQRFFRRGGSLVQNWYYCGQNTGDGATFVDELGDLEIVAAGTLELDNDRAVPTVAANGKAIYGQPLPSIWGPLQGYLFACGDPYRPGHLYYSKREEYDSWPADHTLEVTAPSEELMSGLIFGSDAYVFSRKRLYHVLPDLHGDGVSYTATKCQHGLINRNAFCVGYGGIYFAANDGLYFTQGGLEISISDENIEGIFKGETRGGLPPVRPTTIRLEVHENQLWFIYKGPGAGAKPNVLIFDLYEKYWRQYDFLDNPTAIQSETSLLSAPNVMIMGTHGGLIHVLTGAEDNETAIQARVRTGALNQGAPRREKIYGDLAVDMRLTEVTTEEVTPISLRVWADNEAYLRKVLNIVATDYPVGTTGKHAGNKGDWDLLDYLIEAEYGKNKDSTGANHGATYELIRLSGAKDRYIFDVLEAMRATNISLELTWTHRDFELYFASIQYMMDEAVARIRWDSEEINHGVPGAQIPLYANISMRATHDVTMVMTTYRDNGGTVVKTYTIPNTGSTKLTRFVPFQATKGVLFKYVFTSDEPFKIYREESTVIVRAWGGAEVPAQPFGDLLTVSSAEVEHVRGVQR